MASMQWIKLSPRHLLAALVVTVLTVANNGGSAWAQPKVVVKVGTVPPPQHVINQIYVRWGELIAKRSNGAIEMQLFPSGQLGGQKEMVDGLTLGSLQATEATVAVTNNLVKEVGVFDLPFLFRSDAHAYNVYNGEVGRKIAEKYLSHGFRVLGFSLGGVRHPFGGAPLVKPDDIKGRKIRVIQSPLHIEIWRLVGANPTPIPDPEIYTSLQTKVVEFADNTASNYFNRKWYEVAPHITTLGHIYAINALMVSERWWQRQSAEHRKIMEDSFRELIPIKHQMIVEDDRKALKAAVNAGAHVTEVKDLRPWQDAMKPIWQKWAAGVSGGQGLIDEVSAVQ